ncbi:MAG TPA: hypothetical protein VFI62_15290, partial [Burkholderiales bacterium]|nr:hypothetical protein [Burkholderiales bacterium]
MTDSKSLQEGKCNPPGVDEERRRLLGLGAAALATSVVGNLGCSQIPDQAAAASVATGPDIAPADRVFITNEDSNTLSVINPTNNAIDTTINLTSFDEDPRPPFRFVTGGVFPTHGAMIQKPLYHGCISAHGAAPNPDATLLAVSGRGSSNVYLIDTMSRGVLGNVPNPFAGP